MPTQHPHIGDLSVSAAAAYLEGNPRGLERFIRALENDPRSGIQALAQKARSTKRAKRAESSRIQRLLKHEKRLWNKGYLMIAGVDEVGRGPLAGPVVAAAVILPTHARIAGLNDSKALKAEERETLYTEIMDLAMSVSIGSVDAEEIDRINIYQATLQAMRQAIRNLSTVPNYVLIDGNRVPDSGIRELAIVGGDAASLSIAAASVIAKVTRDREMVEWDAHYPEYGFARHKGYASKVHREALLETGPCPIHRRSFCPVEDALAARSPTFRKVRTTVEQINRLGKLEAYRDMLRRKHPGLDPDDLREIDRHAERRATQLRQPAIAREEAAENWLVQSGYLILERNFRSDRGEIDLIVQRGDTLTFVEVMTAADDETVALERVTHQKQARICRAARAYLDRTPTSLSLQFDVVSVQLNGNGTEIRHFPSAFDAKRTPLNTSKS